jgi:hypothetical protein
MERWYTGEVHDTLVIDHCNIHFWRHDTIFRHVVHSYNPMKNELCVLVAKSRLVIISDCAKLSHGAVANQPCAL